MPSRMCGRAAIGTSMQNNRSGNHSDSRYKGGRPTTKATIQSGDGLMISQVYAGGTADLGRGKAEIEKIGNSRLIKIVQADGSEIRILVVK